MNVYLDNHASTQCDPRVVEAMVPFLVGNCANPSSSHRQGQEAMAAIDEARAEVAQSVGVLPGEIVFTSGATESNNLALLGTARGTTKRRTRIVTTPIEHKSVLATCLALKSEGYEICLAPVRKDGLVELGALADLVNEETLLVSVQTANNEIGTIQPILEVSQIARRVGALVHTDCAQGLGRLAVDFLDWGVDLASLSAHKCYGPKGAGALFVREGSRSLELVPVLFGGGQEFGLRPGTANTAAIVGFGKAAELSRSSIEEDTSRICSLRDRFERSLLSSIDGVSRNGSLAKRLSGSSSIRIEGVEADALVAHLPEISLSSASACNSGAPEPSHVLTALGLDRRAAYETLRVGIGRFNVASEIDYAATRIAEATRRIREIAAAGALVAGTTI